MNSGFCKRGLARWCKFSPRFPTSDSAHFSALRTSPRSRNLFARRYRRGHNMLLRGPLVGLSRSEHLNFLGWHFLLVFWERGERSCDCCCQNERNGSSWPEARFWEEEKAWQWAEHSARKLPGQPEWSVWEDSGKCRARLLHFVEHTVLIAIFLWINLAENFNVLSSFEIWISLLFFFLYSVFVTNIFFFWNNQPTNQ